jgi:hypothetical protein
VWKYVTQREERIWWGGMKRKNVQKEKATAEC